MRTSQRKSTPEVRGGKVQKKNDWSLTPNYYSHTQRDVLIERKRPGAGYRHLLTQKDVRTFISLLPDWLELSHGLNAIVLSPGRDTYDGYWVPGVVHICAWELSMEEEVLWTQYSAEHYANHKDIFTRFGVPCEPVNGGWWLCKFNGDTVRAYQLLHILLHELGHHHDQMTSKSRTVPGRGEPYAEAYALRYEAKIWERYLETFGLY